MKEKIIQIEGQNSVYLVREDGTVWNSKRNRELKGTTQRNEYKTVYLFWNNKQYNFMVHRLVAEAFCENPNGYTIVHHKDGDKLNTSANNLEWVSSRINNQTENRKIPKEYPKRKQGDLSKEWKPLLLDKNYGANAEGEIMIFQTGQLIYGSERNGYRRFQYKGHYFSIHRLVYEAFFGEIPNGYFIDHKDGNRAHNKLENLSLVSQSDNMKNAMSKGHACQVPILQFDKEGNFIKEYSSIQAAANEMNVARESILSSISRNGTCKGFRWKKKK